MRTVRRLRLRFLFLRPSYPNPTVFTLPCCPRIYLLPCRNLVTPIKSILDLQLTCGDQPTFNLLRSCVQFRILLVEVEGIEPSSKTPFSLLHTAISNGQSFVQPIFCFALTIKIWSNSFAVQCPEVCVCHHTSISVLNQFKCYLHYP